MAFNLFTDFDRGSMAGRLLNALDALVRVDSMLNSYRRLVEDLDRMRRVDWLWYLDWREPERALRCIGMARRCRPRRPHRSIFPNRADRHTLKRKRWLQSLKGTV